MLDDRKNHLTNHLAMDRQLTKLLGNFGELRQFDRALQASLRAAVYLGVEDNPGFLVRQIALALARKNSRLDMLTNRKFAEQKFVVECRDIFKGQVTFQQGEGVGGHDNLVNFPKFFSITDLRIAAHNNAIGIDNTEKPAGIR